MNIKKCRYHQWELVEKSNVLQQDGMGYPLRLVIYKCAKCGISEHAWIDVPVRTLNEVETGESVLVTWTKCGV